MNILAMETSTQLGGVAVIVNGVVLAEVSSLRQKSHSENISPFIAECLKESNLSLEDIDAFAVGQGPGSFTGIRVAANAGKSFSYCFNKPLIALDSLTLLAAQVRGCAQPVLSIINAYKNMVYIGLFDVVSGHTPIYIKGPEAIPVRDLSKYISSKVIVVGDGWNSYHPYFSNDAKKNIQRFEHYPDFPQAKTLGLLAEKHLLVASSQVPPTKISDWTTFRPLYIRASEAEETKRGILITPLT